jgi:uncharacterized protein
VVEKVDPSVTNISANASANPQNPAPIPPQANPGFSHVTNGVWLDHRHALIHPSQGWMAIADLHYGYELRRRREGHLTPDWGRSTLESRLTSLLSDHQPNTLILVGDIMDGTSNVTETLDFLARLRPLVPTLIPLIGNHDHRSLHHDPAFTNHHEQPGFFFHHGHEPLPTALSPKTVVITGHHHPAINIKDGAGLRLKLPTLIREHLPEPDLEQWILPAFSPWAAGGEYRSPHPRLATWACAPHRVWPL